MSLKFLNKTSFYRNKVIVANNFSNKFKSLTLNASTVLWEQHAISKKVNTTKTNRIFGYLKRDIRFNSSTSSKLDEKENNELTVVKSKRLMRLIYARVHPDLYTNHFQAQVII